MTRAAVLVLVLILSIAGTSSAGEEGAAALDQALVDLASDLRAACVAARPHGIDFETLAWLRRARGVETAAIVVTGGETPEVRAALDSIGAVGWFLGFPDEGETRESEEALSRWGEEEALARLVEALREVRPHLLLVGQPVDPLDGRHEAVAALATRAFGIAAEEGGAGDPIEIAKLYLPGDEGQTADLDMRDPVRGVAYRAQGAQGRALAGFGAAPGETAYRLAKTRIEGGEKGLLAGLPVPRPEWLEEKRWMAARSDVVGRLQDMVENPDKAGPPPLKVGRALAAALGITVTVERLGSLNVVGRQCTVKAALKNGSSVTLAFVRSGYRAGGQLEVWNVAERTPPVPPGGTDVDLLGVTPLPWQTAEGLRARRDAWRLVSLFWVRLEGLEKEFPLEAEFVLRPKPAFEWSLRTWDRLLPAVAGEERLHLTVVNRGREAITGRPVVEFEGTDRIRAEVAEILTVPADSRVTLPIALSVLEGLEEGEVRIGFRYRDEVLTETLRVVDVGVPSGHRIGVVETPGDVTFEALRAMGVRPERLRSDELLFEDLTEYDTIVLGVRPYASRPELRHAAARLLAFVEAGGNLIVLQCDPETWDPRFAPHPLTLSEVRVTREDADLTRPDAEHRLLVFPNEISDRDIGGWIRERGRNFPATWDEDDYEAVILTSDPGQPLLPGLLTAKVGAGWYTWTCLSLHLQLARLDPAALKLLANAVSYPVVR